MKAYSDIKELKKKFISLYGEEIKEQEERYQKLLNRFKKEFKCDKGYFASSSGRVEICGNHTDHNGGMVISSAISLDTLAVFMPNDKNVITVKSEGYDDIVIDLSRKEKVIKGTSSALILGVIDALKKNGYKVKGFNASITSNVLGGAGISSSASFEVLIVEIFNFLYNNGKISKEEKAIFSQHAESEFFGKPCGLLDQTAISYGGLNLLDFSIKGKIKVKSIGDTLKDYSLILVNTGGSHENLTDEYAAIPSEMFSVAKAFNKNRLIELKEEDFYKGLTNIKVSDRATLRAIHFYEENKRVIKAAKYIKDKKYDLFLDMINKSGESSERLLQNCYVFGSGQPIVKAVAICKKYLKGGANRVHGGGFAGTILNIVNKKDEKKFIKEISAFYNQKDVIPLKVRELGTVIL